MKGSMKQIEWAEELKAQAMTVLEWARDNYPADLKGGNEQTWKENMTGLMMCLDRVECASDIIDALKTGNPYACTLDDMSRIAAAININLIRAKVITAPTQDEIRAELAATEQPAEEAEEETIEAEAATVSIHELTTARHGGRPELLLRNLGGDPDSIIKHWQQRYNEHPDPTSPETYDAQRSDVNYRMSHIWERLNDPSICAAEAADCAYYEIIKEIKRLYFSRLDRAAAVTINAAIGPYGHLQLAHGNAELTFNAALFRSAWEAAHPEEKKLPTWHGKED